MLKKFLVVVDTQYDFVMRHGALYVKGAEEIVVPGIEFITSLNPDEYEGVLFTHDTHSRDTYYSLPESKQFPIHCIKGEKGWLNVFNPHLVSQAIALYTLEKGVFSMWEEPGLRMHHFDRRNSNIRPIIDFYERDKFFEQLAHKDDVVIQVMGVATDYCVKWAVDGFTKRGFKVEVIDDLCRGIDNDVEGVFSNEDYLDVAIV